MHIFTQTQAEAAVARETIRLATNIIKAHIKHHDLASSLFHTAAMDSATNEERRHDNIGQKMRADARIDSLRAVLAQIAALTY
jgi:hypothetical protein